VSTVLFRGQNVTFWPWNSTVLTDLEHLYRIYSISTQSCIDGQGRWALCYSMVKMSHFGHGIVQCSPTLTSIQDLFHLNSILHRCSRSVSTVLFHGQNVTLWPWNSTVFTDLEHLYSIYFNPTHDKHQWLLLQFIVLLMMDAKGVRNV